MTQIDLEDFIKRGIAAQSAAKRAGDEAMAQVASHNPSWMEKAITHIRAFSAGGALTGEQIRYSVTNAGLGEPGSPNAWGALIRLAIKRGYLIHSGRYEPMTDKRSHGRKTPVYVRTGAL